MNLIQETLQKNADVAEARIVGIDTSRAPVRLVAGTPVWDNRDQQALLADDRVAFSTLAEFQAHWKEGPHTVVAVPVDDNDPLGIRRWLLGQHDRVQRYEWSCYKAHLQGDVSIVDQALPDEFRRAYVLALYAAYRLYSVDVCRGLWAKLLEAAELLQTTRHAAHRLSVALAESPPT